MKIYSMVTDRKELVKELAKWTGIKPEYKGAPTFIYQVGAYQVLKDGTIEIAEEDADLDTLRGLYADGLIDNSWDSERDVLEISIPMEGHTGYTLANLVHIIACRGEIISKAIGRTGAFRINERFLERLLTDLPETVEGFLNSLEYVGGNDSNAGLEFLPSEICFTGFPLSTDSVTVKSYTDLVELMNKMALGQKRVLKEKPDMTNEKYSFRVWLLRLGMKGDSYKMTRQILLKNLSGHSAFRTKEQEEVAKIKNKERRAATKEENDEPDR